MGNAMFSSAALQTPWPGNSDFPSVRTNPIVFPAREYQQYEQAALRAEELVEQNLSLQDDPMMEEEFRGIVGSNSRLKAVIENIQIVAPADSTVLILGETGTGKELIARAIHDLSPRKNYPFVKVNCAAIPSGLLESELFGHERGAFTGAIAQKIGRFELANKGTLFLDEIGDIPLELQPKLLRVLQEQEFERLGSTRTQRVDVRVVAATNANLAPMVAEKNSGLIFSIASTCFQSQFRRSASAGTISNRSSAILPTSMPSGWGSTL
jgi:formate hydrogenlyase transcriptional activator